METLWAGDRPMVCNRALPHVVPHNNVRERCVDQRVIVMGIVVLFSRLGWGRSQCLFFCTLVSFIARAGRPL